jgi:FkbM family methyltransferase
LAWLIWEITVQHDYESQDVAIHPGDTVFDCGAHIGVFSRYALNRGASRVIAVEPDPVNIAVLEANFEQEIAAGRVILVKAGVWDRKDYLDLSESDDNSARNSFVHEVQNSHKVPRILVLPLDEITTQLQLDRVDFIKMDIEGSEHRALLGSRQTIARFQPRMAICTYHLSSDPTDIPEVVKDMQQDYRIHAKDVETGVYRYIPKVMFFSR